MINTLYPGRPNYTGPTSGVFTFVHHQQLVEWSDNINERIAYIRSDKPKHEVESRLYHLLYLDVPELTKARDDWDKAREDWDKAHEDFYQGYFTWYIANEAWAKAWKDLNRVLNNFKPEIMTYVNKHIPDHRWDGKELRFD